MKARKSDPITSHLAAAQVSCMAAGHHERILRALKRKAMGKTAIAQRARMTDVQVARRLPELRELGLALPTGKYVYSAAGRPEREWRIV